jgi:hypothetical protein
MSTAMVAPGNTPIPPSCITSASSHPLCAPEGCTDTSVGCHTAELAKGAMCKLDVLTRQTVVFHIKEEGCDACRDVMNWPKPWTAAPIQIFFRH